MPHTVRIPLLRLAAGLLVALWPLTASAQLPGFGADPVGKPTDYVTWTVEGPEQAVAAGTEATITLDVAIDSGWKMYAMDTPAGTGRPVRITAEDLPDGLTLAGTRQATPKEGYDPNFDQVVTYFEDSGQFMADVAVAPALPAGTYEASGEVAFMICNDRLCLPPTRVPFSTPIRVVASDAAEPAAAGNSAPGAAAGPEPSAESEPPAAADEESVVSTPDRAYGAARADGLWSFLLLAIGAGLAALLTPCVFPMIPLTVSYFTKHADSRSEAVKMASVYGVAIIGTFTGLGVLMALLVGASGAQSIAANPWVNLFIGLVFVFFALSLLGLFELRLPNGLLNYFNRQSNEHSGYTGVLFMGLTLTLVSFSCTAPLVGALLAATAGGEWFFPVVGMAAFSATFALPFFVFALIPNRLSDLPRSGSWMVSVKVVLGFVELAAALKFLSNADLVWGTGLLSRPLAIALSVVIFLLAGMYLIDKLHIGDAYPKEPRGIGVPRLMLAIGFFGLALYMAPGLFGASLGTLDAYLPPRSSTDYYVGLAAGGEGGTSAASLEEGWHVDDLEGALAEARAESKPLFIDFTGYTCTNCRAMESNVFPRPAVAAQFDSFVLLRLYTDGPRDTELQRYQLDLVGTTALPTYVILDPASEQVIAATSGMVPADDFASFLADGAAAYFQRNLAFR